MPASVMSEPLTLSSLSSGSEDHAMGRARVGSATAVAPAAPPVSTTAAPMRLAQMVRRHVRLVIATTLVAIIVAGVCVELITPTYTSSAQIMVQRSGVSAVAESAMARQSFVRNEEPLIVSTSVLATALSMPGVHEITPLRGRGDAMKLLKQQIRVEPGRGDDLLSISFDAADPQDATRLVAAVVDAYIRFRSGVRGTVADGSVAVVEQEKTRVQQKLKEKWTQLQDFGAVHGLAQGNEQVDAANESLHELGLRLARAHVEAVAARGAYDEMQRDLKSDPAIADKLSTMKDSDSSLSSGDAQTFSQQICALQSQLAGFGTKFMVNHPTVQFIRRKIEDLKVTRDAIIQHRWESAVQAEAQLQVSYNEQQTAAALSATHQMSYEQRKGEVADLQKQVEALDQRLKELDPTNKAVSTTITVVDPASASDRPTKPRSAIILMVAAIAGLCLGCGVAALREYRQGPGVSADGQTLGAGLPVLARLPAVPRRHLAMSGWRDRMADSVAAFADACRKVERALEGVASSVGGTTVLVTSTGPREGKSTLASLLAISLARDGKRVLLVDANLHAPVQGRLFGVQGDHGLANLLEDETEADFRSAVHAGSDRQLDLLLPGSGQASAEKLLNSPRLTNLLASMAAEYDFVLIDSPAVSTCADARIIAGSCDATIVLAREVGASRKVLAKTRDDLTNVGGNVIGVVLNGGMEAVGPSDAIVSIDVSRHRPVQVAAVRHHASVDRLRSAAARVDDSRDAAAESRVTDDESNNCIAPEEMTAAYAGAEPVALDIEIDSPRPVWSRLLLVAIVVVGWMTMVRLDLSSSISAHLSSGPAFPIRQLFEPGHQGLMTLSMVGGGVLMVMLIAAFNVKPPRQDVALMFLTMGLGWWSFRGGATNALWMGSKHGALFAPAAEAVVLFASLLLMWSILRRDGGRLMIERDRTSAMDGAVTGFAHASVMAALMIVLSRTGSKNESMAVIGFASCLASMTAYRMAPGRSSVCFWMSPLAVAVLGYVCVALHAKGLHLGVLNRTLAVLARPLPMDYASMGPIGAITGFWIAASGRQSNVIAEAVG